MDNPKKYLELLDTKKKRIAFVVGCCFFLLGGLAAIFFYMNHFYAGRRVPFERVLFMPLFAIAEIFDNRSFKYSWDANFSCYFLSVLSFVGFAFCFLYAFCRDDNWIGKLANTLKTLMNPFKVLIRWIKKGS